MKEVTRIITARITVIRDIPENVSIVPRDECAEMFKNAIKDTFCIDDIVIDNIQDFILEKEEPKWKRCTGERWIGSEVCEKYTYYTCSKCGGKHRLESAYCPDCGAKMT